MTAGARPIVLATGGTGGHVFPAEALAGELETRGMPFELITDSRGRQWQGALADQFRHIVEDLRRRYVLSYSSSNRSADGNWRRVEIRPHTPGLVVSGPTGYFPPDK